MLFLLARACMEELGSEDKTSQLLACDVQWSSNQYSVLLYSFYY